MPDTLSGVTLSDIDSYDRKASIIQPESIVGDAGLKNGITQQPG